MELLRLAEALTAQAVRRLAVARDAAVHTGRGYTTPNRWVAHESGLSNRSAQRITTVIEFARSRPAVLIALTGGRITIDHVAALATATAGLDRLISQEAEADLLTLAASFDPDEFARRVQQWRSRVEADADGHSQDAEDRYDRRHLYLSPDLFGGCSGRFQLDAEGAEALSEALQTNPDATSGPCEPRTLAQRNADQLVDLAHHYNGTAVPGPQPARSDTNDSCCAQPGISLEPTGARTSGGSTVEVIIDLDYLAKHGHTDPHQLRQELARTGTVPTPTVERFMCDASWRRVITDGPSVILDYGKATPDIPVALRKAVQRRDRSCQFEGCDRSWQWTDVHHIHHKSRGGPTNIDNLVLLCRHHHTFVHTKGWTVEWDPLRARFITLSP